MKKIYFALSGNEKLTASLVQKEKAEMGKVVIRKFPDGETYIRILSNLKGKEVIFVCTLHEPDTKLLPLYFLSKTAKELGAESITLIAPYLAYMRQDKAFHAGEAITSSHFANLVSSFIDYLITVDPHLHRRSSLSEIYNIPTKVLHATDHISKWINKNVKNPILIGPDSESDQWVSMVAKKANVPYITLSKIRHGDCDVEISIPKIEKYEAYYPVLIDDIISTGKTMIQTINHLKTLNRNPPICIGIHAVFSKNAFEELKKSGAHDIVTCNTIHHESNKIDISDLLLL